MSRLTSNPFHKPSPFNFAQPPLSPPETTAHTVGPSYLPTSVSVAAGGLEPPHAGDSEMLGSGASASPEGAGARFRRVSSLAYHSSGLRESRERSVQRNYKSFVVIIPPPSFLQEHGQLGHTLSLGPRHRLSQGMLMPLFPTMYGQLMAIAKEFNFPSTAGICLYLQYTENGVTVTPRISDDSWQLIWSHVFESPSPSPGQRPPICGKLEFDIDLRHARWYSSWISSAHQREYVDMPMSMAPSTAPSVAHFREDSRTTMADEEQAESHTIGQPRSFMSTTRHVPRKLSLVDRLDTMSMRSESRGQSRVAQTPPEGTPSASQALSPIVQEEEPKTAKLALESRVKNWRASASLKPTSLAAKGQISLEPAYMPNSIALNDAQMGNVDDELNLEDFNWSVSSLGPNDYDPESPMSWDRVRSVDLAHRMEGSVCLTPSDCTSFGPSDYTLPSPVASDASRPFTPDIAHRMYEDVPPTPGTATSWGPSSEYSLSPLSEYRAPSLDLGERTMLSRPPTPSTATSWGPASWPPSPVQYSRAPSVHLGDRGDFSRPATPSTATSWGAPLSYPPSPTTPFYVSTPDAGHRGFEDDLPSQSNFLSFPYYDPRQRAPWAHTWPYTQDTTTGNVLDAEHRSVEHADTETLNGAPWVHTWPYVRVNTTVKEPWQNVWPYRAVNSVDLSTVRASSSVGDRSGYPYLNIYPSVYPNFELYPVVPGAWPVGSLTGQTQRTSKALVVVALLAAYPVFNLYPAVYPFNLQEIYPAMSVEGPPIVDVKLAMHYPTFNLYPAVYPHITPYPAVTFEMESQLPTSVYPHFDLYPAVSKSSSERLGNNKVATEVNRSRKGGYPHFDLYPSVSEGKASRRFALTPASVRLIAAYPVFDLYPAVYPHLEIYPTVPKDAKISNQTVAQSQYPYFDLYTAIKRAIAPRNPVHTKTTGYPHFNLYPPITKASGHMRITVGGSGRPNAQYPMFNLYPAVYPHFDLYPVAVLRQNDDKGLDMRLPGRYPVFNLYPAVYPHFDLYPLAVLRQKDDKGLDMRLPSRYPVFNLYPAVYPHFDLYPLAVVRNKEDKGVDMRVPARYPSFNLYPAVYPHFDLYPLMVSRQKDERGVDMRLPVRYPVFNLYPAIYPHFDIYPSISSSLDVLDKRVIMTLPSRYPTFDLYPAVYPHFDLYPSIQPLMGSLRAVRRTHKQLHELVIAEKLSSRASRPSDHRDPPRRRLTHAELHRAAFPDGVVSTPTGSWHERRVLRVPERRLSSARSPVGPRASIAIGRPPTGGLPAHPAQQRMSTVIETKPTDYKSPVRGPVHRSNSSISRSPTARRADPSLASVDEQRAAPLSRSSSMALPRRSVAGAEHPAHLDRSNSTSSASPRPMPKKRDSLVLQRVKAFNSSSEDAPTHHITLDALAKFPMPPVPPLPKTVPKALDRSKFPFA